MGIFIQVKNDWQDKEVRWQNVIIILLCIAVLWLIIG